jgi:hypothetical protein
MNRFVGVGFFILLLLLTACSHEAGFSTWYVDSLVKVFPDDRPDASTVGMGSLMVARNDYANLQIALRSRDGIAELGAEVDSPLEAEVRWVDYVAVGSNPPRTPYDEVVRQAPGLFPDPLREAFPFELPPEKTYAVWVTVRAPSGTEPGEYISKISFTSGDQELVSMGFKVIVVEATVPQEQTLQVTNWSRFVGGRLARINKDIEVYSDDYWDLLENTGRVLAQHRQNVIITPVSSLVQAEVVGSSIGYDFSRLDRWIETFERSGLLGTIEGGHLLGRGGGYYSPLVVPALVIEKGEVVRRSLTPEDPRAETYLRSFLGALHSHLKQRGWDRRYIQHIFDEPHDREARHYRRYGQIIRESLPGIKTIDAVSLNQDISFFADVCDIWVPVLSSFDNKFEVIRNHVEQGGQAWYYTCVSPQGRYLNRFIDYSLLKVRLLHWFNFRHDLTGFLHWGGNAWGPHPFDNVQTVINSNRTLLPAGDNAIFYPDSENNSILSSIRLEAMRDGIEDYELLVLLKKTDPAKADALVAEVIPHVNDYLRDWKSFRKFHQALLEALP